MSDEYRTIKQEASDEFVEKKSRFIGYVKPVATQQEALDFIESIRKKHWDATHNVYAYVLRENMTKRFSDDGEPQGTAGIPVIEVLNKENLTDCAVVVTRYFGGTLLGAGGLVRAYSHAAKLAVDAGGISTVSLCQSGEIVCDYSFYGKLTSLIPEKNGVITDTKFEDNVRVGFAVKKSDFAALKAAVIDSSNGKFDCKKTGEFYADLKK
ncbi:MAG: YigZ family protein [Clostridia bacterium]|nr:YigZ family protein [Clostridia bacterium]